MPRPLEEEFRNIFAGFDQCQRILSDLTDNLQRRPIFNRALRNELRTMLDQVREGRTRFAAVLIEYQKEYEAFYSGMSPDNRALSCRADSLEEAEHSIVLFSAGCIQKISELVAAFPGEDQDGSLSLISESFTFLGRSAKARIRAGKDRGGERTLIREDREEAGFHCSLSQPGLS